MTSKNTSINKNFAYPDCLTVKLTIKKIHLQQMSKFLADINARYKTSYISRIQVNQDTGVYYVFAHITVDELAVKLQEVSPFPC